MKNTWNTETQPSKIHKKKKEAIFIHIQATSQTSMASWLVPFRPCCVWRQATRLAPLANIRPEIRWSSSSRRSGILPPSPPIFGSLSLSSFSSPFDAAAAEAAPQQRDDRKEPIRLDHKNPNKIAGEERWRNRVPEGKKNKKKKALFIYLFVSLFMSSIVFLI